MSKSRWLAAALICSLAIPEASNAQTTGAPKEQAENFTQDVLGGLTRGSWNLFLHGGFTGDERFVLQRAANPLDGERALRSGTGFNFGGGAGVDVLLRMGFRATYTFTSSDLSFRTDNGDGSDALDIEDVGTLKWHTAGLEVVRYMLPTTAGINPYATLGVQGTWWQLDEESALVTSGGASSPFSLGPLGSFGVQFRATGSLSARLEITLSSGRNPFTGNESFRALSGPAIDEPTTISRRDYRLIGVLHF